MTPLKPPETSLEQQLDQYQLWRREYMLGLKLLGEWLQQHGLLEGVGPDRLARMRTLLREERVELALPDGPSGGKSELIQALLAGATPPLKLPDAELACPLEIAWDARLLPGLRLLPVETRLEPRALGDWRAASEPWIRLDLDLGDPAQQARTLDSLTEWRPLPLEQARALGFWSRELPPHAARPDNEGRVRLPRWRHAMLNLAHPLLQRGLALLLVPHQGPEGADAQLVLELLPQVEGQLLELDARQALDGRRERLRIAVAGCVEALRLEAGLALRVRRRDLDEQRAELEGLRGKSAARLRQLQARLAQERSELEAVLPRLQALRLVHHKLLDEALDLLDTTRWKQAISPLSEGLARAGSAAVRHSLVAHTVAALGECLQQAADGMLEIREMLNAGFAQLNADHGFALQLPAALDLAEPMARLRTLERRHERYLASESARWSFGPVFAGELVLALGQGVMPCFEDADDEMRGWSSLCLAQLDVQWLARQRQLQQRGEAITAMLADGGAIAERLSALDAQASQLARVEQELQALAQRLIDGPALRGTAELATPSRA